MSPARRSLPGAIWPASAALIRADAQRRFTIDDHLLIPTADGAKIAAMLVRPRAAGDPKLTSLLNFTIYAKDEWSFADAVKMAAYGYAGVVAYTRGKGRSPGLVVPYKYDRADAATVIDWLARQPWSDGRVGMLYGGSEPPNVVKPRPSPNPPLPEPDYHRAPNRRRTSDCRRCRCTQASRHPNQLRTGRDVSREFIADAGKPLSIRWLAGIYLELGVRPSPKKNDNPKR